MLKVGIEIINVILYVRQGRSWAMTHPTVWCIFGKKKWLLSRVHAVVTGSESLLSLCRNLFLVAPFRNVGWCSSLKCVSLSPKSSALDSGVLVYLGHAAPCSQCSILEPFENWRWNSLLSCCQGVFWNWLLKVCKPQSNMHFYASCNEKQLLKPHILPIFRFWDRSSFTW